MAILVAEDSPVSKELLKKILNKWGFDVLAADDGLEALEIFKNNDIRIVIADWMMPNMDGIKLCEEIRKFIKSSYVYIIIVTAKDKITDINDALAKGADDFITKPVNFERLKVSIKSAQRIISLSDNLNREIIQHARASERLNSILKYSSDIIYTLDLDGNFTSVNKVARELTGYTEKELLNINFRDFIPQENQAEIIDVFSSIVRNGNILKNYPFKVIIKDGTERFFETSVGAISNGKEITGFQGSSTDITKRVNAVKALQESEKQNRMLIDSMKEGLLKLDENGILTFVNNRICEMLGYSKEELIGKHVRMLHEKEDEEKIEKRKQRRMQGLSDSYEVNHINKQGKIIPTIVSATPIFDLNGNYESTVAVITDISAIKNAEQERKAIEVQLRQSDKMASIGQLAAGVAHEINNPIGFVSSNLNTLAIYIKDYNILLNKYHSLMDRMEQNGLADHTDSMNEIKDMEKRIDIGFRMDDVASLIEESCEGTERVKKIVQDLKDFAHPGEDKPQYTDIHKCIESSLNIVWNEIKYRAQVIKDYSTLPEILCYPQQLNQVFANLFVNAAQAIKNEGEIKIKTSFSDEKIEIKISDNGSGISKEDISKVFDPFFTTKDVGEGTGLGLNVAYNIIQKHNGEITVKSKEGHGTTFIITLPENNTDESLNSNK
ncbi:MAG: PAS domain S-box protein [Desulfobacteraceae bacterium]|jgi:PAS domain S-box-containing protein